MNRNPFEYEQATTLSPDFVNTVFIEDHSFTRFLQSTRNVFLVGERGSGKSMTLLYNSIATRLAQPSRGQDLAFVGIYIPCNTTLTHKREYELFEDTSFRQVVSEHFMVLGMAHSIAQQIQPLIVSQESAIKQQLAADLGYILDIAIEDVSKPLEALILYLEREASRSQRALNALRHDEFRSAAFTFSSLVQPLILSLRRLQEFKETHFLMLIDDAHDLNSYQKETLNSWLAFRDRSGFSFKVAVADHWSYSFRTLSGSNLLEGHDFLLVDLQKPFQSAQSDFGKMATEIIEKRLALAGISASARDFFPVSTDFDTEIEMCRSVTEREAQALYPEPADSKRRADHIYKFGRVRYFRERAAKANLPPYSGFDTIAHVSTGVVRNLLMPCYWMWDQMISELTATERATVIPPHIQSQVILSRSGHIWEWLEHSLVSSIDNCTYDDAQRLRSLLSQLGDLFRFRLLNAKSEPRAIAFSVSAMTPDLEGKLLPLLDVGRRAQLIYFRSGPSKDGGRRETFYVPNRLLWPIRGLDVVGQHARASLKAIDPWGAALGRPFPQMDSDEASQGGLFDDDGL